METNENQANDTSADAATTNITIIQVSSANIKDKLNSQSETSEQTEANYMNNVQIIPSNYSPSDQNAITTVQVTNDANTLINQVTEQTPPLVGTNRSTHSSSSSESHDDSKSARQFGAVTNISIGASEKPAFQPEQLHYEQVFITHTPSGASISTGNSEPNEIQPKINRIKVDSVQRADDSEIRPSTSTASTVTFSVAAAAAATVTGTIPDSITSSSTNQVSKPKDAAKNKNVEINHENDISSSRRPMLSRGLTEAVILRPSRKDVNVPLNRINPQGNQVSHLINHILQIKNVHNKNEHFVYFSLESQCSPSEFHTNPQQRDSTEQRKRSSSTSDTQRNRNRSNNNNNASSGANYINNNSVNNNSGKNNSGGFLIIFYYLK